MIRNPQLPAAVAAAMHPVAKVRRSRLHRPKHRSPKLHRAPASPGRLPPKSPLRPSRGSALPAPMGQPRQRQLHRSPSAASKSHSPLPSRRAAARHSRKYSRRIIIRYAAPRLQPLHRSRRAQRAVRRSSLPHAAV